jgi:hypothetical protein
LRKDNDDDDDDDDVDVDDEDEDADNDHRTDRAPDRMPCVNVTLTASSGTKALLLTDQNRQC